MQAPWPFCVCAPKRTVSSCVKKSTGMRSSCSPIWNENLKRAPELAASISDANSVSARLTSRPGPMIARSQANQGSSLWSFLSFLFGSSDVSSVFDFEVASPEGLLVEALAPIIVPLGSTVCDQIFQGHRDAQRTMRTTIFGSILCHKACKTMFHKFGLRICVHRQSFRRTPFTREYT